MHSEGVTGEETRKERLMQSINSGRERVESHSPLGAQSGWAVF